MLNTVAHCIDTLNTAIGKVMSWLCLFLIVVTVAVVLFRTLMNTNSLAAQESVTYAHSALFMLCIAMGVVRGSHVRVDVFYRAFSPLTKAWVDAFGALLLLLPFSLFLVAVSWDFALRSWAIAETSSDTGGLAYVFVLKSLIPVTGCLLALQALSECIKALIVIYYHTEPSGNQEGASHD